MKETKLSSFTDGMIVERQNLNGCTKGVTGMKR
jgi:hypothetical protein